MIKALSPITLELLHTLFNRILEKETIPPISPLPNIYELFSLTLRNRIKTQINKQQPVEQTGFRSGFSTTDHLQAMNQILDKYKEFCL